MKLTKEQQDIIEKAANKFADDWWDENDVRANPDATPTADFRAGVAFALSSPDLMRGVLSRFKEWEREHGLYRDVLGEWYYMPKGKTELFAKDDTELVTIFLTDK